MKKISLILTLAVMILITNVCVLASNFVLETDVVAFINEYPIDSYNIDNFVYICADDLQNYGFDVNKTNNTINITRNKQNQLNLMDTSKLNILKKAEIEIEKPLFEVYPSKTKIYLENELINAFDIDNKPFIQIDELQRFGYFNWDSERREVKIDMLSFDIDNELKNVDTSKKPVNSYGIIKDIDDDDYQPSSRIKKGYFDENGELVYGIDRYDYLYHGHTKFYEEKRIDLKNNQYIYISYFYDVWETRSYFNKNIINCLQNDNSFNYNYKCLSKIDNNTEYKYTDDKGKLFMKRSLSEDELDSAKLYYKGLPNSYDTFSVPGTLFNGTIYDESGNEIYNGEIEIINLINDNTFLTPSSGFTGDDYVKLESNLYCAKAYSESNGIIYSTSSLLCYRGNVSNGLPNGMGNLYNDNYVEKSDDTGKEYKIYLLDDIITERKVDINLVYVGSFKNGLYDGEGIRYKRGVILSKGTWKDGKREGNFIDIDTTYNNISFEGNYSNSKRNGYCVLYRPKVYNKTDLGVAKYCEGTLEDGDWKGIIKQYEFLYIPEQNIMKSYLEFEGLRESKDGHLDENGIFYNSDGTIQKKGHFIDGVLQSN